MAIEHALREAFGDDAWGEVRIEHTRSGHAARIEIEGHVSILAHMDVEVDGTGWTLMYSVGRSEGQTLRFLWDLADALLYAESLHGRMCR